jgi:hypothetical protein
MLGKLTKGTVLFILAVMIATWVWSVATQQAPEPRDDRVILYWFI